MLVPKSSIFLLIILISVMAALLDAAASAVMKKKLPISMDVSVKFIHSFMNETELYQLSKVSRAYRIEMFQAHASDLLGDYVFDGDFEAVKSLVLEYNADVHKNNDLALRTAILRSHFEMAEFLISSGADIHVFETFDALEDVLKLGSPNMLQFLLGKGLIFPEDPDLFIVPVHSGNLPVLDLLARLSPDLFSAKLNDLVLGSVIMGHASVLKYLVEVHGADVNAEDGDIFFEAVGQGHLSIIEYLVKAGLNFEAYKNEAVKVAILETQLEVAEFLFSRGAIVIAPECFELCDDEEMYALIQRQLILQDN